MSIVSPLKNEPATFLVNGYTWIAGPIVSTGVPFLLTTPVNDSPSAPFTM